MQNSLIPLNENTHRNTGILDNPGFAQLANQHLIPIAVDELVDAATEFPVMFVKNTATGKFTLVAIMGLKPESNLYCGKSDISANYIPRVAQLYPFALRTHQNGQETDVCLQQNAELVVENAGSRLFTESGNQSEYLQRIVKLLTRHAEQQHVTDMFIDMLLEKELLHEQTVKINLGNDDTVNIGGVYSVNTAALESLSDRDFLEVRKNGALQVIHAQLHSLKQLNRLVRLTRQQLDG